MNVPERLNEIMEQRGWTRYKLAKESKLPEATLANIFHRGTIPTIATLEIICQTLNISLSQFFADNEMIELTPELKEFYEVWMYLTPDKRDLILQTMKFMKYRALALYFFVYL